MILSPAVTRLAGRRVLMSVSAQRRMFMDTIPMLRAAQPIDMDDVSAQASLIKEGVVDADDVVFPAAESLHENSKWSLIQVRNLTSDQKDIKVTIINQPAYNWLQNTLKKYRNDPIDLAANFKGYMAEIPKREKRIVMIPYLGNVFADEEYSTLKLPADPAGNNSNDQMGYMIAREVGEDYSNRFLFAGVPVKGGHKYRIEGESTQLFTFHFPDNEDPKATMDRLDYYPLNA